jgi:putative ubiquitin-RnfH superfamily antitoxin RatB of RatAB toxin-antitoxin module
MNNDLIKIEIAYGVLTYQVIISIMVPANTSVSWAIEISKIANQFPQFDFSDVNQLKVGIFGKRIDISSYVLRNNDRIEIYRPLPSTPNQKRLARVKKS